MDTNGRNSTRSFSIRYLVKNWDVVLLVLITAGVLGVRLATYGNHTYSVAMNDTDGYIAAAQSPPFSWASLLAERPPTVPFLYRIFQPNSGYKLTNVSLASIPGQNKPLAPQPGFEGIVIVQMILSILGWCLLAWEVFWRLKHPFVRLAAAATILIFAFSPQLADWDSILSSESLSFSLFAILLALTIELVHRLVIQRLSLSIFGGILVVAWLAVVTLWVFTRDAQVYVLPITLLLLLIALVLSWRHRKRNTLIALGLAGLYLTGLFAVQQKTVNLSMRWEKPFIANLIGNVLPYPARVDFFVKQGMPFSHDIKEAIQAGVRHDDYRRFADFMAWMKTRGYSTYTRFLISNPFWASLQIFNDLDGLFGSNLQPYFPAGPDTRPTWFETIGNMFHPLSTAVLPASLFLSAILFIRTIRRHENAAVAWAVVIAWLLILEALLLFVGYHGDFYSKNRHVVVPMMQMRLSAWLVIFIVADFVFVDFLP